MRHSRLLHAVPTKRTGPRLEASLTRKSRLKETTPYATFWFRDCLIVDVLGISIFRQYLALNGATPDANLLRSFGNDSDYNLILSRQASGVRPSLRLNTVVICCCDAKPQYAAMSRIGREVVPSRFWAI